MARKRLIDREQVLEVSIALADEHGYEAVTLASVAKRLGIRIPSLYNHIDGLPGLRHALKLWGLRQLGERLRRSAVGKAGDDAVVSLAYAYRAFAHEHPGIYPLTLRAAPDEPTTAAAAQDVLDVVLAVLAPYAFSDDDKLHVVRGLRSMLHGFVDLEIAGGFELPLERDESFRRLIDLLLQGLHARQANRAD